MNHIAPARAREILRSAAGKRIAVLGDYMLDRHLKGIVQRISPEAPVPVVEIESEFTGLGGAGNVVQNLAALGVKPLAFGAAGDDSGGITLKAQLEAVGTVTDGLVISAGRKTTEKIRIIAHDQHVVRADRETVFDISGADERQLLDCLQKLVKSFDALILQDYNKGVLTDRVIQEALKLAAAHSVPVAVDPKFNHFFDFRGVHLFKPNIRELERALGARVASSADLIAAGANVFSRLQPEMLLVTRGDQGMTLFVGHDRHEHIPTRAMKVHDVSGAGDTVIATFVVAEAGGADPVEAAVMANYAAGVVCGEVGVVPIASDALLKAISGHD